MKTLKLLTLDCSNRTFRVFYYFEAAPHLLINLEFRKWFLKSNEIHAYLFSLSAYNDVKARGNRKYPHVPIIQIRSSFKCHKKSSLNDTGLVTFNYFMLYIVYSIRNKLRLSATYQQKAK